MAEPSVKSSWSMAADFNCPHCCAPLVIQDDNPVPGVYTVTCDLCRRPFTLGVERSVRYWTDNRPIQDIPGVQV